MLDPLPSVQLVPSVVYCQLAPLSMLVTLTICPDVMPSLVLTPVSDARLSEGLATAVSTTTCRAGESAEVLPAASVWWTNTS